MLSVENEARQLTLSPCCSVWKYRGYKICWHSFVHSFKKLEEDGAGLPNCPWCKNEWLRFCCPLSYTVI